MESKRQIKFGRQIQKDLADIFQLDTQHYFGQALGTITKVTISPDLGFAKIFISVFPTHQSNQILEGLNEHKSDIRLKLGRRIGKQVRIVPELAFIMDDTEEKAAKIDSLLNKLDIPKDDTEA